METFVNDSTKLVLNTGMDISGYSTLKIKYKDPNGDTGEWTAALCPDSDLCMQVYLTGRIPTPGTWKAQAYISHGGEVYHGKWTEFQVLTPLYS